MKVCARKGQNAVVTFLALCASLLALAVGPHAEDSSGGWMQEFYSYLPAAPEIRHETAIMTIAAVPSETP